MGCLITTISFAALLPHPKILAILCQCQHPILVIVRIGLDHLLLLGGEFGRAISKSVGDEEVHQVSITIGKPI